MIQLRLKGRNNKLGIILAVIGVSLVLPFLSFIESWYYPIVFLMLLYAVLSGGMRVSVLYTFLILAAVLSILFGAPAILFRSWERLGAFILVAGLYGPFLENKALYSIRKISFSLTIAICILIGIGSFLGYFVGVNMMEAPIKTSEVGTFGGLTYHSMLLGPIASIGLCYLFWKIITCKLTKKLRVLTCLAMFALFACILLSASRSSLLSAISGCIVILIALKQWRKIKISKIIISLSFVTLVLSPLITHFADNIINKQKGNIEAGGTMSSRESKWANRIDEFKSSPVFGVGFAAINIEHTEDYAPMTGVIELGSSWLGILSMTGIFGFIICITILFRTLFKLQRFRHSNIAPLFMGIITFFVTHMLAEGYVFAAGSYLFFLLWLTLGTANAYLATNDNSPDIL